MESELCGITATRNLTDLKKTQCVLFNMIIDHVQLLDDSILL